MAAAQRQGYIWPTRCRGQALCTACVFEVVSGGDCFSSIEPLEQSALTTLPGHQARSEGQFRLACQARPVGEATIVKRGVKLAGAPHRSTGFFG
jgi:ferredoxin, 2Fe-2S